MHDDDPRFSNAPRVSGLHPVVYRVLAGCVVWTVAALWLMFSGNSETNFQIAAVTFFGAAFILIPFSMSRIAGAAKAPARYQPFSEWRHNRFETASGTMSAGNAAFLVLLAPLGCASMFTVICALRLFALNG